MSAGNRPERSEAYMLAEGEKKVVYTEDKKLFNAGTFRLNREDHTLGNALRIQLLEDENVSFAAYQHPHPLSNHIMLRVQCKADEKSRPQEALFDAAQKLQEQLINIDEEMRSRLKEHDEEDENNF